MADGSLVTVAESWTVGRYLTSTLESHEQYAECSKAVSKAEGTRDSSSESEI